tara:strand:- start:737 stop:1501 length:765 start_codon:yes stop_codon:yes gene_type:complete
MDLKRATEEVISEVTNPEDIDLSSFKVRDTLNPKIFESDQKLNDKIRSRLLMIADDFFETLDISWVDVEDVTLTGSLSNYNWSKFSDVDLHILLNYEDIDENSELVSEYLMAKKNIWNEKHSITIKGYDVEVYAQNIAEEHISTGVYSILWDDWLVKPKKSVVNIDAKKVRQKASTIIDGYDTLLITFGENEYDKVIRRIQNLKTKIKKLRQTGLDREGEYSYENITFKVLRRVGLLEKLSDLETLAYDKSLSL